MTTVRALTFHDAAALATVRLEALENHGRFFTADIDAERGRTRADWEAAATETTGAAMFGAFRDGKLVAIAGVKPLPDDPAIAYWHSDYVRDGARGGAVIGFLCRTREAWCRDHGYDEARFTIRKGNVVAEAYYTWRGAVVIGEEPRRFADGQTAAARWYRLPVLLAQKRQKTLG